MSDNEVSLQLPANDFLLRDGERLLDSQRELQGLPAGEMTLNRFYLMEKWFHLLDRDAISWLSAILEAYGDGSMSL